jgi:hypothetical protein
MLNKVRKNKNVILLNPAYYSKSRKIGMLRSAVYSWHAMADSTDDGKLVLSNGIL